MQLEAFSNPSLKNTCEINGKSLIETKIALDDVRLACGRLEDKLIEKDEYYSKRDKDLQELHQCELTKGKLLHYTAHIFNDEQYSDFLSHIIM